MKQTLRKIVAVFTLSLPVGCGEEPGINAESLDPVQSQAVSPALAHQIGVFRGGTWILDSDRNQTWTSDDFQGNFGSGGDKPFVLRHSTCEGTNVFADLGVKRGRQWFATLQNLTFDGFDVDDISFAFNNHDGPDGIPLALDGRVVEFKDGKWTHDRNGNLVVDGPDAVYDFGRAGDLPVIGSFGGGRLAVFRPSEGRWFIDTDNSKNWTHPDEDFLFGANGDIPVAGDFNTNIAGTEIAMFRVHADGSAHWYVDFNGNHRWDSNSGGDQTWPYGRAGDIPVVGGWIGNVPCN